MQDVQSVFKGKRAGKVVTFEGIEDFKKIMGSFEPDEIAEITLKDGTTQSIYPGKQNLSPYLLEIMKKDGLTDYTQFFTENLKKEFRNRKEMADYIVRLITKNKEWNKRTYIYGHNISYDFYAVFMDYLKESEIIEFDGGRMKVNYFSMYPFIANITEEKEDGVS